MKVYITIVTARDRANGNGASTSDILWVIYIALYCDQLKGSCGIDEQANGLSLVAEIVPITMYTYIGTYRVGAWIEVEYFPYTFKFMNFQMTKMYGSNGTLYEGTKI